MGEGEVEAPQQRRDQLAHLERRDVLAEAGAGAGAELCFAERMSEGIGEMRGEMGRSVRSDLLVEWEREKERGRRRGMGF